MSTQPAVPAGKSLSGHRSERRISVHLPLKLRRRDQHGLTSEEDTSSENLCRSGAAFVTRFDVAIGSDIEIYISPSHHTSRRKDSAFETHGKVVHVVYAPSKGERLVGVQFTGPRFQRVFRSESTA
ncbi:MAG: PilZ domain-containing protein [Candidatus Acidiferrum sp.]